MQREMNMGRHSFMDRLIGVLTLKAPIYREIADDTTATTQAAAIVVIVALIVAIIGAALLGVTSNLVSGSGTDITSQIPGAATTTNPVGFALRSILNTIIGWLIGSWIFAFVSTALFQGKTNMWEMARVFGFTNIFGILGIIPCLGIVGLILSVIGAIIGIREASEFDTTKAILTGVVGFIGVVIVTAIIGLILSPLGF